MIVQQLVVIPVLSQEGVHARPSTLPSWANLSGARASVVVAHGLSSCGSQALERRLSSCGAQA